MRKQKKKVLLQQQQTAPFSHRSHLTHLFYFALQGGRAQAEERGAAAAQAGLRPSSTSGPPHFDAFVLTLPCIFPGRKDVRKQKKEVLLQHSKLVARWSDLTAEEHAWYLQHRGEC